MTPRQPSCCRPPATTPDPFVRLAVEFLARTGLCKGELLDLTVNAVVQIGSAYWLHVPVGKLRSDRYFPDAAGETLDMQVCMFTNSPDEHFIVDVHPEYPRVSIAAGFSGHGFKFCSVIGEIMADLALDGRTRHDIGLFRLSRFAAPEL